MLKLRYEDVNWSLPVLFSEDLTMFSFLNILYKKNIHYKLNLYGAPICNWNLFGTQKTDSIEYVERVLDNIKFRDVMPVLSFEKYNISGNDIKDDFCNSILEKANFYNCFVLISSEKLFKHIKKNFPNIKCIASYINTSFKFKKETEKNIINEQKEADYYNNLIKDYDKVILRPDFVKSYGVNGINDISKVEVIVNFPCIKNCKYFTKHIEFFENLDITTDSKEFACPKDYNFYEEHDLFLTEEEIQKLINLGVKNFRIEPESKSSLIYTILNYLFVQNLENADLIRTIFTQREYVKYFFTHEILKNAKNQNYNFIHEYF